MVGHTKVSGERFEAKFIGVASIAGGQASVAQLGALGGTGVLGGEAGSVDMNSGEVIFCYCRRNALAMRQQKIPGIWQSTMEHQIVE